MLPKSGATAIVADDRGARVQPQLGGYGGMSRRAFLAACAAALLTRGALAAPSGTVRFGLTPVFLDSDVQLLAALEKYLSGRLGRPVALVKRRTYQEITLMLLSEQLHAAWICGYPYVQYSDRLSLLAVPVYRGKPLYQSYLIVNADSPVETVADLRGRVHAFSDPDSNSGFLVTQHLLATMGESPDTFFSRYFFTYGHRNVVRAVSSGLAESGSVDGYVWEVLKNTKRRLVEGTRVIRKSEWLGFPPVACNRLAREDEAVKGIAEALISMNVDERGREILATLYLDGFIRGEPALFDGIVEKYRFVQNFALRKT